jgi:predicted nuclease of predicted toxin-antitoxin system
MKFICDVHISFKLVKHLNSLGHKALHVNDLLNKWHTKDSEISAYADLHDLILITKDYDFKNSFLVNGTPRKLIKVSLGNVSNSSLIEVIVGNLESIKKLDSGRRFFIEIDRDLIVFGNE